jgi:mono/diheme cytochrome c family protein
MKPLFLLSFGVFALVSLTLAPETRSAEKSVDYLRDIKPILVKNCTACHGAEKQRGGLRLDTAAAALEGGNSGPVIVPGKGAESKLVKLIRGDDAKRLMPPKGDRLTAAQIALLNTWIDQGAKHPASEDAGNQVAARDSHWAFKRPVRPAEPAVKNGAWVRNPIDRFVLARLEKEGLVPSPEADRVTLIRRLSLDLTGLPPSVQEVDAFVSDSRPNAYERLVDRLLESPHFGERMARHWLDLARYADSNGFTIDGPRAIWKYRDWVINAFNRDLPFDRFTIEQIAGDLLPGATLDQKVATGFHRNTLRNEEGGIDVEQFRVESVVDRVNTTGSVFLGLTIGCCQCHDHKFDPIAQREFYQLYAFLNNADEPTLELPTPEQLQQRARIRAQMAALEKQRKLLDTTTPEAQEAWQIAATPPEIRATLPSQLQTILALPENGRSTRQKQVLTATYRKLDMVRHVLGGLAEPLPFMPAAQAQALVFRSTVEQRLTELKKSEPQIATTLVMQERPTPRITNVHIQGDFTRKGVQVFPGVPAVLHPLNRAATVRERSGDRSQTVAARMPNRLDLARWLVDPNNPLTPRVAMNRFWQHYFGLGLVETENDFGTQGTPPSHPELLDWLATEFIHPLTLPSPPAVGGEGRVRGWSIKAMHRLIVTSATYRQASKTRPELATVDPRNRLLARQSRLRLDAEIVRDSSLTSSGLLTRTVGGPSVFPPQPEGVYAFTQVNKNWKPATGPDRYRRGMYTYFWRSAPHPGLTVFDAPDSTTTCTRRNRSNTPLQALTLLNDQAYLEFAQGLAGRVLREVKTDDADRLRYAFRLCVARSPSGREQKILADLLGKQRTDFTADAQAARLLVPAQLPAQTGAIEFAAWTAVARVLLNLDEFITRE